MSFVVCRLEYLRRHAARSARRAEPLAGLDQLCACLLPGALAAVKAQELAGDAVRLHFVLQELRLDRLAEQDVRQSEVVDWVFPLLLTR